MRALIVVMDSVGIGGALDAARYGDEGADTVGHIADACAAGRADSDQRQGPLQVPYLTALGLGEACERATGRKPPGLQRRAGAGAAFGHAHELSRGKDTPSGHWEIAGVPVPFDWGYFPKAVPTFPPELIRQLCASAGLPGILGNRHASGTEIMAELGEAHIETGQPICYTSADSVFQIAAHEQAFGLERLYRLCEAARPLVDRFNIGRVIARPFVGETPADFRRTANRRDYAVPPPDSTILDVATAEQRHVVTIGKIADIFAHRGTGHNLKGENNDVLFTRMLEGIAMLGDGGLIFANFVDFDTLYGHRRDVAGYARALEAFDARLPELLNALRSDDLLVITADHGCDPTWGGSDHTRESVPVLIANGRTAGPIGARSSFADIGATVAAHLQISPTRHGRVFW
ncbi:phosphopentomutase [Bradyrhizobium sp. STM 3809]|uniref:phosphopentomutase n=1 Tax=Bradyrhizobium sp. STM 3809 TaxID=551936 RepID=UPI0002408CBF|nr:phosphopentomutase [Bradyrhizobium sp. STM 3809]CCD99969.1 phosphopentomutase [Bradyrhizobium sp. STM 3809]